jgi:DNA polymerase V
VVRIGAERQMRLMGGVDGINRRHGKRTVRPLAMGFERKWQMKRTRLSQRYTRRWDELLTVRAN